MSLHATSLGNADRDQTSGASRGPRTLRIIAWIKLIRGFLLLIIGIGMISLLREPFFDVSAFRNALLEYLPIERFLHQFGTIDIPMLQKISIGICLYAILILTQGFGLWFHKKWGGYLTIIATASFIPLEIYELFRETSFLKMFILAINVLVLLYLVKMLNHPCFLSEEQKETEIDPILAYRNHQLSS